MSKPENSTLEGMQSSFLEALRHREEQIFRYLAILGPALGGFFWLLVKAKTLTAGILTAGTIGIQLLLLLGAVYSLALGYNYRCVVLQLAKLQVHLKLTNVIRNNASTSALCMRTACWDRVLPEKTSVVPLNPEKPYNLPMEYASYMSMGLVYAILGHTSSPVGGFVPPPHPVLGVRRK